MKWVAAVGIGSERPLRAVSAVGISGFLRANSMGAPRVSAGDTRYSDAGGAIPDFRCQVSGPSPLAPETWNLRPETSFGRLRPGLDQHRLGSRGRMARNQERAGERNAGDDGPHPEDDGR